MDSLYCAANRVCPTYSTCIDIRRTGRCATSRNSTKCHVSAQNKSSSFLGSTFRSRCLSLLPSSRRQVGRMGPSALLNAAEYRKQFLEKGDEIGDGSESDDDLCPIECVREVKTLRELENVIGESKSNGALVIVDFFRNSCGSCRYIEKGFTKLCKGAGNGGASVVFLKHNVMDEYDEQSDIAEKFKIKVVPLFHFYKSGELVEIFPTRDKAKILETIYKHLDVDQTIEEWSDVHGLKFSPTLPEFQLTEEAPASRVFYPTVEGQAVTPHRWSMK